MIAIVWSAKDIAARTHPIRLTKLLSAGLRVVVRRAQGGEPLERRECLQARSFLLATLRDRDSMVDNLRGRNESFLQTGFATRMLR